MPKPSAVEVDAGGRAVRVSSPDRVIYEATDTHARGHEADGGGVLPSRRGRPHAGAARPADRAGALAQGRPRGHHARHRGTATRPTRSTRSGSRRARPTTWRRRRHLPLGPHRRRDLPDRDRGAGRGRADGHADLPPLAGTPHRRRPPRRAAHRPRPAPGTSFRDAVRVAGVARELLDELGLVGFPKTCGNRGVHVYVRIEPRWDFVDVRHAAIAFGRELERRTTGVTTKWWKEERGDAIFVDYNQNSRDRTIASAYSLRPEPGRAGEHADGVGRARRGRGPAGVTTCSPCPSGSPSAATCAAIDDVHDDLAPLLRPVRRAGRRWSCPTRRTTRRCRASRPACSPARRSRRTGEDGRRREP